MITVLHRLLGVNFVFPLLIIFLTGWLIESGEEQLQNWN
jgi:hypothetical protein